MFTEKFQVGRVSAKFVPAFVELRSERESR